MYDAIVVGGGHAGCDITIGSYTAGELSSKCKYLMEKTNYANRSYET